MTNSLKKIHIEDAFTLPKEETLRLFYDRMVTTPITARTALKKELIATIGLERTKGVFVRYGWHCGVSDAQQIMSFRWETAEQLIRSGPKLHILHGYLDHVEIENMIVDAEDNVSRIDLRWTNSFEAAEHLKDQQISTQPVCHNLCGYASGYLTTILGKPMVVKETSCKAMGDEYCRASCIPLDQWDETIENEYRYYQSENMVAELNDVMKKLKLERDNLKKANDIQKQLSAHLLGKKGLQKAIDLLYDTTGIPMFIENENHQIIAKSALPDFPLEIKKMKSTHVKYFELDAHVGLLRAPILFDHQVKGYCSFIYINEKPTELEYMIIDKLSFITSVILLNEAIQTNTEQNIKRNFLTDILEKRMNKEEIYKIAYYLQFPTTEQYWLATLQHGQSADIEQSIQLNEQLMHKLHLFFKDHQVNTMISQKDDHLILLIDHTSFQKMHLAREAFLEKLLKYCEKYFEKATFALGVSSIGNDLCSIDLLYHETLSTLKTRHNDQKIYYYEDLELESLLFQIQDATLIDRFATKNLGALFAVDKDYDLTRTLYAFIENGISINNTSKALCISISGLRYRLHKISTILNVALDDTKSLFSIYMALKLLKVKQNLPI